MNNLKSIFIIFFFNCILIFSAFGTVKPAKIFSSNMVLQKGVENPVWGWADKNEVITVSINGKTVKTKTDKEGKWMVKLPVMDYGGPFTMAIKGKKETLQFANIMIGEVWFCSGQSNMEFPVNRAVNSSEEIPNADYLNIRLFTVPNKIARYPLNDIEKGEWSVCSPQTVSNFSAVAYFFGREIYRNMNVAVGLINASWGGTVAESWTSSETIRNDSDFVQKWNQLQKIDFANYGIEEREKLKKKLGEFPVKDSGLIEGYNQLEFDDSKWKTVLSPGFWENQGYENVDGIAWYRKTFDLNEDQASRDLILSLGGIDDKDFCWVNGVLIGNTTMKSLKRIYKVPSSALKIGQNVVAIKITDEGNTGGIYGSAEDLFARSGKSQINLSGEWRIKFTEVKGPLFYISPNDYPTLLFNGMVNPILPFGIKGVIWYQGESNAQRAKQYQRIFPNMIADWRNHWKEGNFPFLWVQLANFLSPSDIPQQSNWAELREAQTMALKLPNTGMASAIDLGEAYDVHPKNKQDVGKRLALNALKIAYGKDIICVGPFYKNFRIEGNKIYVSFDNVGSGLKVKNKYGYINGFSIAGENKEFFWAEAKLLNEDTIVLYSDKVAHPIAIRYGWANNPEDLNLYNSVNLPANPFRTDNW